MFKEKENPCYATLRGSQSLPSILCFEPKEAEVIFHTRGNYTASWLTSDLYLGDWAGLMSPHSVCGPSVKVLELRVRLEAAQIA